MTTQAEIDSLTWFHSFDFGNGLTARGYKSLEIVTAESAAYFDNLTLEGRSVLDIGAWTGANSFAVEARGASRVLASDHFVWADPRLSGYAPFQLARKLLDSKVEDLDIDLPDITPERVGTFDVVLFAGVFYHLLNPAGLMRQVSKCATDLLVVETHQDALDNPRPGMIFYPGATLNNDATNWWGPNPHCMYELLLEFGFTEIFYRDHPLTAQPGRPDFRSRGIYQAFRSPEARLRLRKSASGYMDLSDPAVRADLFRPTHTGPGRKKRPRWRRLLGV